MRRLRFNPLTLVPKKYRAAAYILLTLAAFVATAYQANDGDWEKTLAYLGTTLVGALAASNVRDNDDADLRGRR
jgi:hypothetical protein